MKEPIDIKKIKFNELKNLFDEKRFAIPEIQREFVWTKTKILDLLDSIKKHYPIGSFLICKVPANSVKHIKESTVLPKFDSHNKECYIVVDGQQRLSVLYSILTGKTIHDTRRYKDGINFMRICLSPSQDKEIEFDFYNTTEDKHASLYDVLNDRIKDGITKHKNKTIKECQHAFQNYSFPFIFISGYDQDTMRDAFIRLNRGGTSLSSEDKIFALSYHKDTDLRRHCGHLLHDLKKGFDSFDKRHFIKSIAADLGVKDFVSNDSLNAFAKKMKNPRDKFHIEYKKKHKKMLESIKLAADFLIQRFKHASYLPYPTMLSILSIFYYRNNNRQPTEKQICEIERWFWLTGFTKRYSGGNQRYNQLNDAEEMKKLAESRKYKIDLEGKANIEPFSIDELSKIWYNKSGAVRNAFFCYLINKKPLNFTNGEIITVDKDVMSIFNSKNDHHIFSRKLLKPLGFYPVAINSLLNICFLSFGENITITYKPPWEYLKDFKSNTNFKKILDSHVLPNHSSILYKGDVADQFKSFEEQRKVLIKKDLIKMMEQRYVD